MIRLVKEQKVKEGSPQYRELGGAHGVLGVFERETGMLFNFHSQVTTSMGDWLSQRSVLRV